MSAASSVKLDTRKLKQLDAQMLSRARDLIATTASAIEADTKQSIVDYPAVDTGAYLNSTVAQIAGLSATIGHGVEYAAHVEFGTVKMKKRPSLIPAFEKHKKQFLQAWKELFK